VAITPAAEDPDHADYVDYSDCASDWHREIGPQVLMAACPNCGSEDR